MNKIVVHQLVCEQEEKEQAQLQCEQEEEKDRAISSIDCHLFTSSMGSGRPTCGVNNDKKKGPELHQKLCITDWMSRSSNLGVKQAVIIDLDW